MAKNSPAGAPADASAPADTAPPATPAGRARLVAKLSTKTIVGKVPKDPPAPYTLYRIIGKIVGVKHGDTTMGPYTAFLGSFEATNAKTGERFRSGKCFLPNVCSDMIEAGLRTAQSADDRAVLAIGLDVGVEPDTGEKQNAYGYKYTVTPIYENVDTDALADLRSQVPALTFQG